MIFHRNEDGRAKRPAPLVMALAEFFPDLDRKWPHEVQSAWWDTVIAITEANLAFKRAEDRLALERFAEWADAYLGIGVIGPSPHEIDNYLGLEGSAP